MALSKFIRSDDYGFNLGNSANAFPTSLQLEIHESAGSTPAKSRKIIPRIHMHRRISIPISLPSASRRIALWIILVFQRKLRRLEDRGKNGSNRLEHRVAERMEVGSEMVDHKSTGEHMLCII